MNPITEAMARAFYDALNFPGAYDRLHDASQQIVMRAARTALRAAMECEPTDAMRESYLDGPDTDSYRKQIGHAWRALLGAVVGE